MTEISRRDFLKRTAVGLAGSSTLLSCAVGDGAPSPAKESEPYQLGCQTLPYRGQPLSRALEGIRKAGYKFVHLFHNHQGKPAFTPSLSAEERNALRRELEAHELVPFLSFVGLTADPSTSKGLDIYRKELDLCREFGIRTVVGIGPWYYQKFPTLPKRARDWERECEVFYSALERAVQHAESIGVTITLKPHTGITATAKACLQVIKRIVSESLKICWDAGNVSFYEGIHPDPDLPDLAPHVKAVCIKDHRGGRAEGNFPVPGTGQIDHDLMFRILFGAGFRGPLAVERIDETENAARMDPEVIDRRIASARKNLLPLLEKYAQSGMGKPGEKL